MSSYKAESGHWYDVDGQPAYTVTGANGKERNTTLRDARKHNLVPSVTTILGVAAKPALENWKIDQAIKAAMGYHQGPDESDNAYLYRIKDQAKQSSKEAADRGTEIHAMIERGYLGLDYTSQAFKSVNYILEGLHPHQDWSAEASFCSDLGYGGKIDLYCPNEIVVDFKTKDDLEGKDPEKLVYDEHGMQLSAYAMGLGFDSPTRISVFIDRQDPSIALHYTWDKESHAKHCMMFKNLLSYWQLTKNYEPKLERLI